MSAERAGVAYGARADAATTKATKVERCKVMGRSRWLRGLLSCTMGIHGGPRKRSKTQAGSPPSAAGNGGRGRVRSRCSRDGVAGDLAALLALRASLPPLAAPDTALRGSGVGAAGGHDLDVQ